MVYGQLILEQAELTGTEDDLVDQLFAVLVQDFSAAAVDLHGKPGSTDKQQQLAPAAVRKPICGVKIKAVKGSFTGTESLKDPFTAAYLPKPARRKASAMAPLPPESRRLPPPPRFCWLRRSPPCPP